MAYNPKIKAEDIRMSQIVSEFTIEQFYNKYVKKLEIVNDRERQTMGIDSIFFIGKTPYRCDEKSAVRWRNLKTFSMELLFLDKNNNEFIGWFLNDQLVNELYLFIWIDKTKSDTILTKNILSKEDIKEAEFALVEKVQIMEYLKKLGWTKDKLLEKAQKLSITKIKTLEISKNMDANSLCQINWQKNQLTCSYQEKNLLKWQ